MGIVEAVDLCSSESCAGQQRWMSKPVIIKTVIARKCKIGKRSNITERKKCRVAFDRRCFWCESACSGSLQDLGREKKSRLVFAVTHLVIRPLTGAAKLGFGIISDP